MSSLAPFALFGWFFAVLLFFSIMTPRRAVLVSFLVGWLFLPEAAIDLPGLPDLTKTSATSVAVLLGIVMFDARRLVSFRPSWVDLPVVVFCAVPMASSLTNGFGAYDGLATVLTQLTSWGFPYLAGRLYFNDLESIRELAVAVFIGGLVYVPLCLWEVRMSPQLHNTVYGYHPTRFGMTYRWGGYRPMVFMSHGLMLGLWMACTAVVGVWLWRTKTILKIQGVRVGALAIALFATSVLCKSTGAIALMVGGLLFLWMNRVFPSKALIMMLVLVTPAYMVGRTLDVWGGEQIVAVMEMMSEERADSFEGRLENETLVMNKAMEKPFFGWGTWGNWRVFDEEGNDITVSDGLWIIIAGRHGLVGLISMTAVLILPVYLLLRRCRPRHWSTPGVAPAAALAVVLILFMLDSLMNAMLNPIYIVVAGGLSALYVGWPGMVRRGAWAAHLRAIAFARARRAAAERLEAGLAGGERP